MKNRNLNAWLSVGANLAVVVGIMFLTIEIRQNSALVEIEIRDSISSEVNSFIDMVIQDETLIQLLGSEPKELSQLESDRLRLLGSRLLFIFEKRYDLIEMGLADEAENIRIQRTVFHRPRLNYGVPFAWETYKVRAKPEFVKWFERNIIE